MFLMKNFEVFRIITLMRLQVYTRAHALGACPLSLRSYDAHLEWGVTPCSRDISSCSRSYLEHEQRPSNMFFDFSRNAELTTT